MRSPLTAIVTGATQGLGLALVEALAARLTSDDLVVLSGRDPDRVAQAAAGITGPAQVEGCQLDVTDTDAVRELAGQLQAQRGGLDIVISNASARVTPARSPASQVDALIDTNNLGAIRILRHLVPVLRPGGRLLVVASSFGTLGHLDRRLWPMFDDTRTLTDVEVVLEGWRTAVHNGNAEELGWPHWLNVPSKIAQVAAVRVVAAQRRQRDLEDGTLIASVCPGLIDTDASRPWFTDMSEAQTPAQAAEAVVDLTLAETVDRAKYGELVRFGEVLPWHDDVDPLAGPAVRADRVDSDR
jgi:carbonyl reductase 1